MCGIFGYIGKKDPLQTCIAGLEQLEYRGYDSTGIAGISNGTLASCKEAGKISQLKKKIKLKGLDLAIGHTRWATHGKVSHENAHPHFDSTNSIALVHNGIIENYDALREELKKRGVPFVSETDTEVIVQLIASLYKGDLCQAVHQTLPLLKGAFAIALIHKDHPNQIVAAARESPLAVGIDDQKTEALVSSDPNAFLGNGLNVFFLHNDEIAKVQKGSVEVYDQKFQRISKKVERLESEYKAPSKEGFEHYMLKEIYEQPATVQKAMLGRFSADFERFGFTQEELKKFKNIWILACGTSAHAGSIGSMYFEDLVRIPSSCDIASEARYRDPILGPETLVIGISQSGETADTLAALREAKKQGCKILGICNVANSTLTREADGCIFLKAGPEVSVCSTKAFSSQLTILNLLALHLAHVRGCLSQGQAEAYLAELKKIPGHIQQILEQAPALQKLAKKYASYENFFFMGRRYMFRAAQEAALKLKEISYVNANGYPAGELKHGPLALINPDFPVVAFCANIKTQEKILSNLMEVKARGGPILAFAPASFEAVSSVADDIFWLPPTIDELAPFASTVAGQLLAYYIAKERGCDIDQPRNLAKSVTVE
ncbi:MAG: glutamine--fructose-6-phosphate transaminase (isomerizing) [Verrucomicrobia bacterium]|nr:glutamine--fructose-6-phosphate transaminase (isomerizing) [Verrucomicrobiota bacterium]